VNGPSPTPGTGRTTRILPPQVVAELARFRLVARRRVAGRYAGAHASKRFGSSLDFADYREYVAGDDPRRVDRSAFLRLGRLLVKLYEAEDEAAVRVVVDQSASMAFGRKLEVAREVSAAFSALAANGQDRVRILLAGTDGVDAGPWFRGPSALFAVEDRLLRSAPVRGDGQPPGRPDLVGAIRRARQGPRGPIVVVSDLLFEDWDEVVRAASAGRADALLVHVLGREDVEPSERGDLRLVDAETGADVEVAVSEATLDSYTATRDAYLAEVEQVCGQHGVAYARVIDDQRVETLVLETLRRLGVVA
jgi:uncharacterized protein (DUF58 family)